jgi:hypothetical protein
MYRGVIALIAALSVAASLPQRSLCQPSSTSAWHEVGKAGKETVTAEVNNGKVVNMSAGSLPVKKVKSKKKMASLPTNNIQLAANGNIQLAQVDVYYYGYGFDTGVDEVYYWYPAEDVVVTETWIEYTPM